MNAANSGGDVFGTFTDERDGQTYRTVKMPDGKVWMAQNLNYKPESGNSWCYKNDEAMGDKYGRLYDWETALAVAPAGWHLPSRKEWDDLCNAVGSERIDDNGHIDWVSAGKKLKSRSDWEYEGEICNESDDYGFSALPGACRGVCGGFDECGYSGNWWTAAECGSDEAYYRYIDSDLDFVHEDNFYKGFCCSVRCVAD